MTMERTVYSDSLRQVLETLCTHPDRGLTQAEGGPPPGGLWGEQTGPGQGPRAWPARCWAS